LARERGVFSIQVRERLIPNQWPLCGDQVVQMIMTLRCGGDASLIAAAPALSQDRSVLVG
jgi:hypothetical protein